MFEGIKDRATTLFSAAASMLGEGDVLVGESKSRKAANESLKIDIAQVKSILPYDKQENGIFFNKDSLGFGFELAPKSGADDSLVFSMAEFIKTKLPNDVVCQFMLYKHGFVGDQLFHGLSPFIEKGGIYKDLALKSIKYHTDAIKSGYKNEANISANLCDFKVYTFFSIKKKENAYSMMQSLKESVSSELKVVGFSHKILNKKTLSEFIKTTLTPDSKNIFWPKVDEKVVDESESIIDYCTVDGSLLSVHDDLIETNVPSEDGSINKDIVINCAIQKYPKKFALWQSADLFSNLYKAQKSISCPFLLTFTIKGQNQSSMRSYAKKKAYDLQKNNNGIQNFINPYLQDEISEWTEVNEGLAKDDLALFPTCYNLMLYTDEANKSKHVSEAFGCYRDMGFELRVAQCSQWLRFLISMPFMGVNGLWNDLIRLDETKKLTHFNIANMLPVVSDFKGSSQGILLPTFRNQIAFIDTFDEKGLGLSNYNYISYGTSGSGKSVKEQEQITYGLANGEKVFVIDLGDSYKHLCETLGGIYVDASNVVLNPFTLFDFEGEIEIDGKKVNNYIQIRDLIAIMASPSEPLCPIQQAYLLDAVLECWKNKGNSSCVDDVVASLRFMLKEEHHGDRRLSDLVTLLKPFTINGLYGHMFNGKTPLFNDNPFVVFELGALEDNEELMKIVIFVMIVIIQGQFYQSSRLQKKRCIIDEAWRYITQGDNSIASRFIVQGFRTARKHNGGFGVITQGLSDTTLTSQGRAIKDSASMSFIFYQTSLAKYLKENPDAFNEQQTTILKSFGHASKQGFSSLMIDYGESYTFHRNFVDPYTRILFSTKGEEFEALETLVKQGNSIVEATNIVANHYFGDEL